jgi:hypothetical protein
MIMSFCYDWTSGHVHILSSHVHKGKNERSGHSGHFAMSTKNTVKMPISDSSGHSGRTRHDKKGHSGRTGHPPIGDVHCPLSIVHCPKLPFKKEIFLLQGDIL